MKLQWRHDGRDGVSNHQPHDCLLNRLVGRRSKLRVTGLCAGIHRWPMNFPHKRPVTRKAFPFDDVIMCVCHNATTREQMSVWKLAGSMGYLVSIFTINPHGMSLKYFSTLLQYYGSVEITHRKCLMNTRTCTKIESIHGTSRSNKAWCYTKLHNAAGRTQDGLWTDFWRWNIESAWSSCQGKLALGMACSSSSNVSLEYKKTPRISRQISCWEWPA